MLARSGPVPADLVSGRGLAEVLAGAEAVIDCSNIATQSRTKAERFFVPATKNLVRAAAEAGARRYVLLSIVGIDNVPMGYYQAKLAQEATLIATATEARLGYSIVRVTQFHEFAGQLLNRMRMGPVATIPHMRMQPIDLAEVAGHLLDCAEAEPAGRVADLGGPQEEDLFELATRWAKHIGSRDSADRDSAARTGRPGGQGRRPAGRRRRPARPDVRGVAGRAASQLALEPGLRPRPRCSAGPPTDSREDLLRLLRRGLVHPLHQQLHRVLGNRSLVRRDTGQRRRAVAAFLHVVEADHRDVLGHPAAGLGQRPQRAEGEQVVEAEHRVEVGASRAAALASPR